MIKTYILEDLDCAHCAGKIEEAVGKLEGVKKSTCTLLTQKLVVDIEDDKAAALTAEVKKIVKKYEPDVEAKKAPYDNHDWCIDVWCFHYLNAFITGNREILY